MFNVAQLRAPLLLATGMTCCMGIIVYVVQQVKPDTGGAPTVTRSVSAEKFLKGRRTTVNAGLPAQLNIPKIGVNAALEHVSLTSQGDLAAPKNPANAAWYAAGPRPGDSGNAILDGHFGYKNQTPAVFDYLHKLEPGDNLYVRDKEGKTIAFVVRKLKTYSPGENTTDVFRPADGRAHLNLITCKGDWDKTSKSYPARLVVFADKVVKN